jgi:riboflavin-specific deaminase-like protein
VLDPVKPRPRSPGELCPERAWALLLQLRKRLADGGVFAAPVGVQLDAQGALVETAAHEGTIALRPDRGTAWSTARGSVLPDAARMLDLYLPLLVGTQHAAGFVAGHLAQSLDGRVATTGGVSQFISGEEDLVHTHRLRALFDAVVVGAKTVERDDPRLTTRLAEGPNPTRVILDPRGRLPADRRVFVDGEAPTVLVLGRGAHAEACGSANVRCIEVDCREGWMPVVGVVEALADLGLRRLFIEGGGITVSGFLEARLLDRLHLTVAPVLLGSGRPSIALPAIECLEDATRVSCRHHQLGPDMLFDCSLPRAR